MPEQIYQSSTINLSRCIAISQKEILDCLKNCNHNSTFMPIKDIAKKFGKNKVTTQMLIRKLFKWGFIDRVEKGGVFHYGVFRQEQVGEANTHTPNNDICYPTPNPSSNPSQEDGICYPTSRDTVT